MSINYQFQLSAKEILILAALLGHESVLGVDEVSLTRENANIKTMVRQCVRRLERKKLIRYDLEGILYIVPQLRQAVDCMCAADAVGLFDTNLTSRKKVSVYVMEHRNTVISLERIGEGKYLIRLLDATDLETIIPENIRLSQYQQLKEMMLFEEAEIVRKQIEAFDYDNAENRLQKHVHNADAVKTIAKILSGSCGYMGIQIYRKEKDLYHLAYNTLLVAVDNCAVSLHTDENDILCFEALPPAKVVEQIHSQFNLA